VGIRLLAAGALLTAGLARAESVRVAFTPIAGPAAERAEAALNVAFRQFPEVELFRWDPPTERSAKATCAEAKCAILIRGDTQREGGMLHVAAFQGATGELLDSFVVRVDRRGNKIQKALANRLPTWLAAVKTSPSADTPAIAEAPAAEVPAPAPAPATAAVETPLPPAPPPAADVPRPYRTAVAPAEPPATVDDSGSDSRPSSPQRRTLLEVAAGMGTVSRWLSYNQDLFNALSTYTLAAGPLAAGTVEVYPLARLTGPLGDLGLVGNIEHSVGVSSSTGTGASLATTDALYAGGLRFRFGLGDSELGLTGQYGVANFDVAQVGANAPLVPNYDYTFVEGAADARVTFSSTVALLARAGYLQVLTNSLQTSNYFPRASAAGVEGQLGPAIAINDIFELRLLADYRRFFFSMNPKPGDANVAGGAVDQYFCATLEGVARFR
jgi:hypothetical protein